MTKRGMSQEELDTAYELYARAEKSMRDLVEYLDQFGKTSIKDDLTGVSQLVTAKAQSDDTNVGVWVVRAVIPNTTGEKRKSWPLASEVKL